MPRKALFAALALLAALVFVDPARAIVNSPDGAVSKEGQPAAGAAEKPGSLPTAGQMQDMAKKAEARENAASKSIDEMLSKASASAASTQPGQPSQSGQPGQSGQSGQTGQPLQPVSGGKGQSASGRKAIYGDIIIHK